MSINSALCNPPHTQHQSKETLYRFTQLTGMSEKESVSFTNKPASSQGRYTTHQFISLFRKTGASGALVAKICSQPT